VVEDDHDIAELVAHYLQRAGYLTEVLNSGSDVLPRVREQAPDLVLLDLMLPGLNGLEVCRAMRSEPTLAAIPIIMLTAKSEEADRIVGLELGGDDYVTKPFSPKELVARVGAVLRRAGRSRSGQRRLTFGDVLIDEEQHVVAVGGEEVRLTAKEYLLLKYLVEHPGRVLSRDLLLSDVWGYQYTGGTRTVDVHIRRLREKVPVLRDAIVTIKQFGYKLLESPAAAAGRP
jgi:DNA-binding response OmpR family regulator